MISILRRLIGISNYYGHGIHLSVLRENLDTRPGRSGDTERSQTTNYPRIFLRQATHGVKLRI